MLLRNLRDEGNHPGGKNIIRKRFSLHSILFLQQKLQLANPKGMGKICSCLATAVLSSP